MSEKPSYASRRIGPEAQRVAWEALWQLLLAPSPASAPTNVATGKASDNERRETAICDGPNDK